MIAQLHLEHLTEMKYRNRSLSSSMICLNLSLSITVHADNQTISFSSAEPAGHEETRVL